MSYKGNILLVANWESNVGYAWWLMENFWVAIATHYQAQDVKCHLIYPNITQIPESIESSTIIVHECNFHDRSIKNLRKLHSLIKNHNIKFIYLSDSPTKSFFYVLLRFWGIKTIVIHDHTPGDRTTAKSWRKLLKSAIQRIPLYTADHFIAVTEFVYRRFIEVNCIPKKKCSFASNGITPIDLSKVDKKYAYHAFDIPENRIIVITTGRASYYKGIDFFIECANELINNQGLKQLHFLFCGDGPDLNDFIELVKLQSLETHFTFAGKRTDIRKILPSCSIGFHASKGEVGYSLSILEYMSSGLATIVPDRPSTSGATRHLETGIIYHHGDLNSACDAIKLCLSRETIKDLSSNAISEIENNYSIDITNKKLISILSTNFYNKNEQNNIFTH